MRVYLLIWGNRKRSERKKFKIYFKEIQNNSSKNKLLIADAILIVNGLKNIHLVLIFILQENNFSL